MLNSLSHLKDAKVSARDGEIGKIKEAYFDDRDWALRYLVVETGNWLDGRPLLISPYSVQQPIGHGNHLHLNLTQSQVRNSPSIDMHQPVSRQYERAFLRHYEYPEYWAGGALWGLDALPASNEQLHRAYLDQAANADMLARDFKPAEVHLRSSNEVTDYDIQASDGSIGSVSDFVLDDSNWAIRYLVVDTSAWWQSGHRVLIGMKWADRVDFPSRQVHVKLTRAQVKASPKYEDVASIHRDYEERLHKNYERVGYWD